MGGEQAAGVLAQITREQRAREGKPVCMCVCWGEEGGVWMGGGGGQAKLESICDGWRTGSRSISSNHP